jgi:superfamily II DNA/RNA helicase
LTTFSNLGLCRPVLAALENLKYEAPTPIQNRTIPHIIAGKDVVASAETGSGKTAAYALPILECLQESEGFPRALVIAPTRELAVQVQEQFGIFGSNLDLKTLAVYGGTGFDAQTRSLKKGMDIVVATPGRLLDHLERGHVDLSRIEMLVLDEADRLLDMGFMPQVRRILAKLPKERQTLMFSATIDERVKSIASQYLNDPVIISVNTDRIEPKEIEQVVYYVNEFDKDQLLLRLLKELNMSSVVVFTKTRMRADWVFDRLKEASVDAEPIHGDITQVKREKTLRRFKQGEISVLVATDVAARGLDIPEVSHVVNYDLPGSPEDYVHRIGRTGRAGRSGVAVSFIAEDERYLVRDIERVIGKQLDPQGGTAPKVKLPPRRFTSRGLRPKQVG